MVALDGLRGTLRDLIDPSEGWSTVSNRRNQGNSESIKAKILKLVDNALREMHGERNNGAEIAPPTLAEEVSTRSQTTGNSKEKKPGLEPKQKRWRRLRRWRPIKSFPTAEERKLMNKDVNTMSKWDFECSLRKVYERQNQKLQELHEAMENSVTNLKRQADRTVCYLQMQEKLKKQLFKEDLKRLPMHFHNAATVVYTNHENRENLFRKRHHGMYELMQEIKELKRKNEFFIKHSKSYLESTKEYLTWWKTHRDNEEYIAPSPPPSHKERSKDNCGRLSPNSVHPRHKCVKVQNHRQTAHGDRTNTLRRSPLQKLDQHLDSEFYSTLGCHKCGDCYGLGRGNAIL